MKNPVCPTFFSRCLLDDILADSRELSRIWTSWPATKYISALKDFLWSPMIYREIFLLGLILINVFSLYFETLVYARSILRYAHPFLSFAMKRRIKKGFIKVWKLKFNTFLNHNEFFHHERNVGLARLNLEEQ